MSANPLAATIRTKKMAVLIRDARQKSGRSVDECARAMGISSEKYHSYEAGENSPSLPELELFAFFLDTPLDHFWGRTPLAEAKKPGKLDGPDQLVKLRQRAIGVILIQARVQSSLTPEEVASRSGIRIDQIRQYEKGEAPVPFTELEILSQVVNRSIKDFQDRHGPVGRWAAKQGVIDNFLEMPADLQSFVSKPINWPYLEVARRLSEMSVEKLRSIAEGLLEITL
jgi:transcriptional regulator with XRE-family HTH domain